MIPGIDVSNHQRHIDWDAVAASGVRFAICKATEGTTFQDAWFPRNWAEAARVGLVRGAYHYAQPDLNEPEAEADHFLRMVRAAGGLRPGDLVALDLETGVGDVGDWALRFLRHVEAAVGFKPLLYSGLWYMSPHGLVHRADLAEYGLWLADYTREPVAPPEWPFWAIWQHSSRGSVPGVAGRCDLNWFNGDDIERLRAYGLPEDKQPEPPDVEGRITDLYHELIRLRVQLEAEVADLRARLQRASDALAE